MNTVITAQRIVLALLLLAAASGCGRRSETASGSARVIKVTIEKPAPRTFQERVQVQGTIQAKNSARISALTPGTLEDLFVDEGATVKKGQALFQTDKLNLENRVQIEQDNVKVAAASKTEAAAALMEAEATFKKAEADYQRSRKLFEEQKAITLDAFERAETGFKRAEAGLAHAHAVVELAAARATQAESALKIARKQLEDSLVRAPFDGVITRKFLDRGEFAGAGTAVLSLDDPSKLEAAFVLSEKFFARVFPGTTKILITAGGRTTRETTAYYKAPAVHPVTRTFEIKAYLPESSGFAPGMLGDVSVILDEHQGLGIPSIAVGRRGGQQVVFIAEKDKAVMHVVKTGLTDDGHTELLDADTLNKAGIILEGQAFLNDRDSIRLN
ncbi:MAG: efflux RND transporter periplasmic adaptor subunit [Lentisphaerota bacterium]